MPPTDPTAEFAERFRIIRQIGEGGMGVVYEAQDVETGGRLALKTLKHVSGQAIFRLKREFRGLQQLEHPNLVRLGELLEHRGRWYFTMELVDGQDLLGFVRPNDGSPTATAPTMQVGGPAQDGHGESRSGGAFDEGRLRDVLRQLAAGLHYIHASGIVHRDIKPSNVLVDGDGRVVILDFGLAFERESDLRSLDSFIVGTPVYMAPEQAMSSSVTPEADWYAFGVLLYEALTGRLPHTGSPLSVLMEKQKHAPPPSVWCDVPGDLNDLCVDLLEPDPRARPAAKSILSRLGCAQSPALARPHGGASRRGNAELFVGRRNELGRLEEILAAASDGIQVALISGESGVGKSALAARFLQGEAARTAVTLSGKCSPYESMRFKALDGVIDALSQFLSRQPQATAAALTPRHSWELTRVFPVLSRVSSLATAPRPKRLVKEPLELRARAFAGLRELFQRLGDRNKVVVVIDDIQWADRDSLLLLRDLVRPPEPPNMMLLATYRTVADRDAPLAMLAPLQVPIQHIALTPLSSDEALMVAQHLLSRGAQNDPETITALVRESRGHPLYIHELADYVALADDEDRDVPALDEAIWKRVVSLGGDSRRALELVCVRAAPERIQLFADALGVEPAELARHLAPLRLARFVRANGTRRDDKIEPYHDRVREAVLLHTAPAHIAEIHAVLARALALQPAPDPQVLLEHLRGAGERQLAGEQAVLAAERAFEQMAFARAASNLVLALELLEPRGAERRKLLRQLGDARASFGQLSEAAVAYDEAAQSASREESLDLRRRAVTQILRAGRLREGLERSAALMADVGLRLPRTSRGAIMSIVGSRLALATRRRLRRRKPGEIDAESLRRLEICWSVVSSINILNPLIATAVQFRYVREALRAGDKYHAALALTTEMGFAALPGRASRERVERAAERAWRLVEECGEDHAVGVFRTVRSAAHFLQGEWDQCLDSATQAHETLVTNCRDRRYEADQALVWILAGLFMLGRIGELIERTMTALAEAEARGDEYLVAAIRTWRSSFVWLALDDPVEGRRQADASARQRLPGQRHDMYDYYQLRTRLELALYERDFDGAWRLLSEEWNDVSRSISMRPQVSRLGLLFLRGRCAVAQASQRDGEQEAVAVARESARRISRSDATWAHPWAAVLRACTANLMGDAKQARTELASAAAGLESNSMRLFAAAIRMRLGELTGGEGGRAMESAATEWMYSEGIRNPTAIRDLYTPGAWRT